MAATPNGVTMTAPVIPSLTDAGGHIFTFGALDPGPDCKVLRNGTWYDNGVAVLMTIYGGVVWKYTAEGKWARDTATGWAARAGGPPPTPPVAGPASA